MANVLVVDDEEGIRRTSSLFLAQAGHHVTTAGNAQEALAECEKKEFDVILSDIIMPGDDGIRLLERVRELSPMIRFILVTGEPTVETATAALRMGAFDYLPKPVKKDTLCRVVEKAASDKELREQNQRLQEENRKHRDHLELLVNARTLELKTALSRVETTLNSTTTALSMALEMRDSYTAGHQRRVTDLACAIWDKMQLPREEREGLRIAGMLHDLGKIKVPSDILTKPSRLSPAEVALIQEHPGAAWEILRLVHFPWPVAEIVRQHHERLDGSGYPDGTIGDHILTEACVLGVADVVEAMASHRPYRPALGIAAALSEIAQGRGTRYRTDVVDACTSLFIDDGFSLPA